MKIVPSAGLVIAALFVLPESPRFLIKKGKIGQARGVLAYVRHLNEGHEYIEGEMGEIQEAIEREESRELLPGQKPSRLGIVVEGKQESGRHQRH